MALETSGTLSIGGTTTNRSINLELGRSATATSSLGETDLRDLAGVASGAIGIDDFYGASSGYDVENSIKVQANSGNEWFYRSSPTTGNKRTFTFSFWIKRTQLDGYQADNYLMSQGSNARFHFAGHTLRFMFDGNSTEMEAAGRLRDTSAWYHIVLAVDTTQSTNTNRVKAYVNGQVYSFNNNDWPSLNQESSWMSGTDMYFNTRDGDGSYDNSGYWADVVVIDGQQLAPTSFGEFDEDSGIWKPKDFKDDVTFGSQGFYLKFDNASDLGNDSSGNSNNVTLNNIAAANQATDTPTNNFCTYNNNFRTASTITATEGQTKVTAASGAGWVSIVATFGLTSGKWYWEAASSGNYVFYGIADVESDVIPQATGGYFLGYGDDNSTKAIGMYGINGQVYSDTAGHNGPGAAANTVVQIALDMDNRCVYFGANGSYISGADPTSGASKTNASQWNANWTDTVYPALSVYAGYHSTTNFGGYTTDVISSAQSDANGYGTFEYAPPSGYYAICTKNLAEYG